MKLVEKLALKHKQDKFKNQILSLFDDTSLKVKPLPINKSLYQLSLTSMLKWVKDRSLVIVYNGKEVKYTEIEKIKKVENHYR